MKLFIESKTRASGDQLKKLALRIERMTRKAYDINASEMRNAQRNDALVKALDQKLAKTALKKIANHNAPHWNLIFLLHN